MILTCPEHVDRAKYHRGVGSALHEAGGSHWAGVCYFYAAYHLALGALRTDPLFDDVVALQRVDQRLIPDDRFAVRHQMRRGSEKMFGVNDLIDVLHPQVRASYRELHGASIAVRYEKGTNADLDDLLADLDDVESYLLSHERLTELQEELERVRT